jgi:hypothetical protein
MGFRFEFESRNKVLLVRVEGRLTDELLAETLGAIRTYSIATDASAGIFDFSSVTEVAISTGFVAKLAAQDPAMPDATRRRRIIVAPTAVAFGLSRMFQMLGERTRPLLEVVRSMDEALAALGIESAHFEALE